VHLAIIEISIDTVANTMLNQKERHAKIIPIQEDIRYSSWRRKFDIDFLMRKIPF